jgi:Uma2 family endonuclease
MSFYVDGRGLGKVIASGNGVVHLATCRKFAPDIFFIRQSHAKEFEGAPDLVVEVLSSSTRRTDLEEKRPAYQEAGVAEMWFVDMDSPQILVDRRGGQDYVRERVTGGRVTSTVIPGFWIEAAWLWAEPLPN